ncbi:2S sulfur-rich seed storage protein 2 [Linum grandiflorum]
MATTKLTTTQPTIISSAAAAAALLLLLIITTTVAAAEKADHPSKCKEEYADQGKLGKCKSYIARAAQTEAPFISVRAFASCCSQLKKMRTECVCEGLQMVLQSVAEAAAERRFDMAKAVDMADQFPVKCRLSPSASPCKLSQPEPSDAPSDVFLSAV